MHSVEVSEVDSIGACVRSLAGGQSRRSRSRTRSMWMRASARPVRIDVPCTPGRSGFGPALALVYGGASNSPFGIGWSLSGLPAIGIDVRHRAPRYDGSDELHYGGDEIVPQLVKTGTTWSPRSRVDADWQIDVYRSRRTGRKTRLPRSARRFVLTNDLAWEVEHAHPNDTVEDSTYRRLRESLPSSAAKKQALEQARRHAGTTRTTYLDPAGRECGSLARGESGTAIEGSSCVSMWKVCNARSWIRGTSSRSVTATTCRAVHSTMLSIAQRGPGMPVTSRSSADSTAPGDRRSYTFAVGMTHRSIIASRNTFTAKRWRSCRRDSPESTRS